jgi:hypothetical protein
MDVRTPISARRDVTQFDHPWLEAAVAALDDRLRLRQGVFEYSRSRDCVFRIQIAAACSDFVLSDGVRVRAGDRIVNLHLWNEQFPVFSDRRPTLAWGRRVDRGFEYSLRELDRYLASRPDLSDVVAIGARVGFGSGERNALWARYIERFGFERVAAPGAATFRQQMHLFGENILMSIMVLARNAGALHADTLWRDRAPMFVSRQKLQRRYATLRDRAA